MRNGTWVCHLWPLGNTSIYIPNEYIYYPRDRNRTNDRSIYEYHYSRPLYQLSYSRRKSIDIILSPPFTPSLLTLTPYSYTPFTPSLLTLTPYSYTPPTPGPRRVRTVDLTINSRSLYQLSYRTMISKPRPRKKGYSDWFPDFFVIKRPGCQEPVAAKQIFTSFCVCCIQSNHTHPQTLQARLELATFRLEVERAVQLRHRSKKF